MPELKFVTWKEFEDLCFELAVKLNEGGEKFDNIVSISRGGHVISRLLSDLLDVAIFNVSIQSYEAMQQRELKLTQKLGQYLSDQRILLVDEIVDSGLTLGRAKEYLKRLRATEVVSVALHVKPRAIERPDYFARETNAWVIYPYEIRETYVSLGQIWQKNGKTAENLKEEMVKEGFDREKLEYLEKSLGLRKI